MTSGYVHMDGDGVTTGPEVGPFLGLAQTSSAVTSVVASLNVEGKLAPNVSVTTRAHALNPRAAEPGDPCVAVVRVAAEAGGEEFETSWTFLGLPQMVTYPVVAETVLRLQRDVVWLAARRAAVLAREAAARAGRACTCEGDVEWNEGVMVPVVVPDPECPAHREEDGEL